MKTSRSLSLALAAIVFLLTACGKPAPSTPALTQSSATPAQADTPGPTPTPDPCAKENLPAQIQKMDELTRQFDDGTAIVDNLLQGSSVSADQLASYISQLQGMRRNAEDENVPSCLQNLKDLQLAHMNTDIDYFLLKLGKGDLQTIATAVAQDNQLRQQYIIEKARLLGILTIIPSTATGAPGTPAAGTQAAPTVTPTP
ncbi:MAG TPA: hypothetical protein VLZ89_06455 [Anaerolineales bacterium]|nr:hypothetical protein [Anaerolineales bacterium]